MRRVIRVIWLPVVFAVSAGIGYSRGSIASPPPAAGPGSTTSDERLLVFISSSTCGFSNAAELPSLMEAVRERVRSSAGEDRRFVTVGIAKDSDVTAGLNHLAKFGSFDEVMTGRNWANIGLLKYVFVDLRGVAATPQVVIVDRRLVNDRTGTRVEDEKVILRASGKDELGDIASGKTVLGAARQDGVGAQPRPSEDVAGPKGR